MYRVTTVSSYLLAFVFWLPWPGPAQTPLVQETQLGHHLLLWHTTAPLPINDPHIWALCPSVLVSFLHVFCFDHCWRFSLWIRPNSHTSKVLLLGLLRLEWRGRPTCFTRVKSLFPSTPEICSLFSHCSKKLSLGKWAEILLRSIRNLKTAAGIGGMGQLGIALCLRHQTSLFWGKLGGGRGEVCIWSRICSNTFVGATDMIWKNKFFFLGMVWQTIKT